MAETRPPASPWKRTAFSSRLIHTSYKSSGSARNGTGPFFDRRTFAIATLRQITNPLDRLFTTCGHLDDLQLATQCAVCPLFRAPGAASIAAVAPTVPDPPATVRVRRDTPPRPRGRCNRDCKVDFNAATGVFDSWAALPRNSLCWSKECWSRTSIVVIDCVNGCSSLIWRASSGTSNSQL